jgi:hypothetical protein
LRRIYVGDAAEGPEDDSIRLSADLPTRERVAEFVNGDDEEER